MKTPSMQPGLRRTLPATLVFLLAALTACSGPSSAAMSHEAMQASAQQGQHQPDATSAADWKPVTDVLGRTGKFGDGNTVYRIPLTRSDLHVTTDGIDIKPGLSLGGYAAFAKYPEGTMLMGDLVVTEAELPKVTDALQAHGIQQTAVHKHLLEQSPAVWWTHIHAMGDPAKIAEGLKAALDATAIPPASAPPATQPPVDLDTAGLDGALGRKGTSDGGIYKYNIARKEIITDGDDILPPTFGVTTALNFQPLGGGKAAINGDFALTESEVQPVMQALRKAGIAVVELHNHSLTEQPRLFYMHFWAADDATALAKGLRAALDATNAKPAA